MNSENTKREELHPLRAGGVAQHVGDEFVGHFGDRLQAAGDEAAARRRQIQEGAGGGDGRHHEERGIGEGEIEPADLDRNRDLRDLELVDRIDLSSSHFGPLAARLPARCSVRLQVRTSSVRPCSGHFQTLPFGNHSRRTHDIQHAGAKTEQQEDDQTPGRCSRQPVDHPAKAGADHYSGDELAGQPERLAVAGRAARSGAFLPLLPVRLSRRKRCFEVAPAALQVVVAVSAAALPARPGFSGFVWPFRPATATPSPGRRARVPVRSKSRAT